VNFASVSDLAIRFWSNSDSVLFFCFSFYCGGFTLIAYNRISGVMVSVLATRVVDHGFKSDKTRDYKIDSCCFSEIKVYTMRSNFLTVHLRLILDQQAKLAFHSAISLKLQPVDRHCTPH
jgi:hypothetical protein